MLKYIKIIDAFYLTHEILKLNVNNTLLDEYIFQHICSCIFYLQSSFSFLGGLGKNVADGWNADLTTNGERTSSSSDAVAASGTLPTLRLRVCGLSQPRRSLARAGVKLNQPWATAGPDGTATFPHGTQPRRFHEEARRPSPPWPFMGKSEEPPAAAAIIRWRPPPSIRKRANTARDEESHRRLDPVRVNGTSGQTASHYFHGRFISWRLSRSSRLFKFELW